MIKKDLTQIKINNMQFPETKQTEITELIMDKMYKFNPASIIKLETPEYNKIFSHIFNVLNQYKIEDK